MNTDGYLLVYYDEDGFLRQYHREYRSKVKAELAKRLLGLIVPGLKVVPFVTPLDNHEPAC